MITPDEIAAANKTSRSSKAIGGKAITPKAVRQYIDTFLNTDCTILDFGAGKSAAHARAFVEDGFNCLAHEFGDNVDPRYHSEQALQNKYDIVYASNVLNVHVSLHNLLETLDTVKSVMKDDGVFIANFPLEPRKMNLRWYQMHAILMSQFGSILHIGGTKQAPIWRMFK